MQFARYILSAVAVLVGAPASAVVVEQSEAAFVITLERSAPGTPADAWRELIVPSGWWSSDHTWSGDAANMTIEAKAGGCFCERLPANSAGAGSVEHMRVIHAAPATLLRMVGGLGPLQSEPATGVLSISLRPDGAGTRLTWNYAVSGVIGSKVSDLAPQVDRVLQRQLDSLALHLGRRAGAGLSSRP